MNNDTIKLLNLEGKDIDLSKSHVDKVDGKLICTIVLNNTVKCCKECGSLAICSQGYISKKSHILFLLINHVYNIIKLENLSAFTSVANLLILEAG